MKPVLQGFTFEIQGLVQGVCFRKYTQREASRLGLSGWVANTRKNTVIGQVWFRSELFRSIPSDGLGDEQDKSTVELHPKLQEMKDWLTNIGSPHCRIDHASFQPLPRYEGSDLDHKYPGGFQIRPNYP